MKVLFIGGTGVISSACSQLAVARGIELFLLNRGETKRSVPESAKILRGDIRDRESVLVVPITEVACHLLRGHGHPIHEELRCSIG